MLALSSYHVETDASLYFYKVLATVASLIVSVVHFTKGEGPVSTWILALAHLLYVATCGAFVYAQYA
jgi:hypothetical protein